MDPGLDIASERWFFRRAGEPPRLTEADERHALQVLRLASGERVAALDGCGGLIELELFAPRGGAVQWNPTGRAAHELQAGERDSPLPWLEVLVATPKGARADELVDRLTQLGVAAITFLVADRTQAFERRKIEERLERWQRIARESCKQCKRLRLPELRGPSSVAQVLATPGESHDVVLDPRGELRLAALIPKLPRGTQAAPCRLWIGPEGGWTEAELEGLRRAGAGVAGLAPYILRVETAAESAAAIALHAAWLAPRPRLDAPDVARSET